MEVAQYIKSIYPHPNAILGDTMDSGIRILKVECYMNGEYVYVYEGFLKSVDDGWDEFGRLLKALELKYPEYDFTGECNVIRRHDA